MITLKKEEKYVLIKISLLTPNFKNNVKPKKKEYELQIIFMFKLDSNEQNKTAKKKCFWTAIKSLKSDAFICFMSLMIKWLKICFISMSESWWIQPPFFYNNGIMTQNWGGGAGFNRWFNISSIRHALHGSLNHFLLL